MPRIEFKPENRAESVFTYPKLKLGRNEKARIIAIEQVPLGEFVHTLKAPVIMNGRVVMENRDGTEKPKEDFLGRYICLGDPAILSEKGRAPDVCPVCAAATETDAVSFPDRRFGMHIIQYTNLKPDSWEVAQWGIQIKAWLFADGVFNKLTAIKEDVGDIRTHDLLLGPVENEMYQKFDVRPSTKQGVWLQRDEFKTQVAQMYKEGQTPYLEQLIATRARERMSEDLQRVILRYRQAFGGGATAEDTSDAALAAEDLLADADSILGDGEVEAPAAPAAAPESDDLLAGLDQAEPSAEPVPEAPTPVATESGNGEKASFDDLLSDLPQ